MNKKIVVMALMLAGLAGCSAVGPSPFSGTTTAPMKGKISGSTYISQDHTFSVALPYPASSPRGERMRVKEQFKPNDSYVSFGYGPPNLAFYRVELGTRAKPGSMQPPFEQIAHQVLGKARKEIESAYGSKTTVIASKETEVNGHAAHYWKLEQAVSGSHLGTRNREILEHDVYAINFRYAVAMVWVQRSAGSAKADTGMSPEKFASSLKLLPPSLPRELTRTNSGAYRFDSLPVEVRSPAKLCGLKNSFTYAEHIGSKRALNVDFVAPDYLWQISGDYFVLGLPLPEQVKNEKSFVSYVRKADKSFIPNSSKPLGLTFVETRFKKTTVNGLPAVQAMGVAQGKAVLVTTAVLHRSVLTIASLIYPLEPGHDPESAVPWKCYNKFVLSTKEVMPALQ